MKYLFQKSTGLLACLKCMLRCLDIRDSMGRKSDSGYSFHHGKLLFFRMKFLFLSRKAGFILFNMSKVPKEIMTCDTKPDRLLRRVQSVLLATCKWQSLSLAVDRLVDIPPYFLSPSYFIKSLCGTQPPVKQRLTTHCFGATSVRYAGLLNIYSRKAVLAQPGDAEVLPKLGNTADWPVYRQRGWQRCWRGEMCQRNILGPEDHRYCS